MRHNNNKQQQQGAMRNSAWRKSSASISIVGSDIASEGGEVDALPELHHNVPTKLLPIDEHHLEDSQEHVEVGCLYKLIIDESCV